MVSPWYNLDGWLTIKNNPKLSHNTPDLDDTPLSKIWLEKVKKLKEETVNFWGSDPALWLWPWRQEHGHTDGCMDNLILRYSPNYVTTGWGRGVGGGYHKIYLSVALQCTELQLHQADGLTWGRVDTTTAPNTCGSDLLQHTGNTPH